MPDETLALTSVRIEDMDPHTWYLLQDRQLAERRALPSSVPLTTPSGDPIPPCPQCGGTAVRSLDAASFECNNGGHCHGYRWMSR
jgi:hypothetical protein